MSKRALREGAEPGNPANGHPAPSRKYPTLAVMASITVPTVEPETPVQAGAGQVTPAQPREVTPPERGRTQSAADDHVDRLPTQPPISHPSRPPISSPEPGVRRVTARLTEAQPVLPDGGEALDLPASPRRRKSVSRPQPLPEVSLALPIAGVHLAVASVAALTGATMLVLGNPGGWWAVTLAGITCIGGWLAYVFAHYVRWEHVAGFMLAFSQVAALGWLMALVGPRASVLVLVAPIALLALRTCGSPFAAVYGALASLAVYVGMQAQSLAGNLAPAIQLGSVTGAVFDGVVVFVGVGLLLWAALDVHAGRERAAAIARSRRYELRLVKGELGQLRHQQEDDAERVHASMRYALQGRNIGPEVSEGPLSALTPDVAALADRIESLQRDREERRRMETAVQRLVRALERRWLGLPWEWPEESDTRVDEIVALLRSPTPRDMLPSDPEDTPTLVPIPSAEVNGFGHLETNGLRSFPARVNGASGPLGPVRSNDAGRHSPLPWEEWDTWRGWDPTKEY